MGAAVWGHHAEDITAFHQSITRCMKGPQLQQLDESEREGENTKNRVREVGTECLWVWGR